jgi:stage V sporulation protein AC
MDEATKKNYNEYVEKVTPTHNLWMQMFKAYVVGGLICTLGQVINNVCTIALEMDIITASTWTSIVLIFMSVSLTAVGIYPKITKFGGAGALVPITGFANSVAAPAVEFKKEGQVFGIGCKIFTIAGPVILYGIFSSWLLGLIYWIWNMVK